MHMWENEIAIISKTKMKLVDINIRKIKFKVSTLIGPKKLLFIYKLFNESWLYSNCVYFYIYANIFSIQKMKKTVNW